jgi:hypothetical protein
LCTSRTTISTRDSSPFGDYIERVQPRYFLHGHQHVDQITLTGTMMVVGVYGETVLDLDIPVI